MLNDAVKTLHGRFKDSASDRCQSLVSIPRQWYIFVFFLIYQRRNQLII